MLCLFNRSYRVQHLTLIYNQLIKLYERIKFKFTQIYSFKSAGFEFCYDVTMSALQLTYT